MVIAKIQKNIVVNIQIVNENDALDSAYTWVDVTNLEQRPDIGWAYDGNTFTQTETIKTNEEILSEVEAL